MNAEQIRELEATAQSGNAEAQYTSGFMYKSGRGVERDYKATEWYIRAATQGHAKAQFSAGLTYYHGKGVGQDYSVAQHWLDRAARSRNADAQTILKKIDGVLVDRQGQEATYKAAEESEKIAEVERDDFIAEESGEAGEGVRKKEQI